MMRNDYIQEVWRRSNKILLLAALFFLSGLFFFFYHGGSQGPVTYSDHSRPLMNVKDVNSPGDQLDFILKGMPDPKIFTHFTYQNTIPLSVSGICHDDYRVVIVYPQGVDYRREPSFAKYNSATTCTPGASFNEKIDLSLYNLVSGNIYYVIKADQKKKGQWYNPY